MKLALALSFAGLALAVLATSGSRADVPPPYEVYGIGATLSEGEPFPVMANVAKGGPADLAGIKNGDGVIAIDGSYTKGGAPLYYVARQLGGPKDSVVELVLLRDGHSVTAVKVKRTVRR